MNILTDKSYKEYAKLSRYSSFPYFYNTEDDKYMYGITAQLSDTTPYTAHIVKRGENLDILALLYYNNPTYFWVIADYNRIQDPYIELEEGSTIKIPVLSAITFNT